MEHSIVNKYSNMIAQEVNQYKNKMLAYFHAQEKPANSNDDPNVGFVSSNNNRQCYTTSLARITYEIELNMDQNSDLTQKLSSTDDDNVSTERSSTYAQSRLASVSYDPNQPQAQTFLTEDTTSLLDTDATPFNQCFRISSHIVPSITFNLCRAFLDHYDQWRDETVRRAEAVMYSKHDELDKEMDFQMHLHEPRRIRIETDIHNVRAGNLGF
ncbi:unnamed protein product [Rotaria magnacalcarata]|uniref:Uncharacterized protein n=1 Tax=Rotaria magnacalcarata TaxID=392030 RepID=A0A8S3I9Z9_9BILA|nr:unnamed protein product [Rotaria magnacalcarata]